MEIVVTSGPLAGRHFKFDRPDNFLCGRSTDTHMCLASDGAISRHHFMLEVVPPLCRLTDLGSRNGTFVNGVRFGGLDAPRDSDRVAPDGARTTLLNSGDEIAAGASRMRILIETGAARGASPVSPATQAPRCPLCGADVSAEFTATEEGHRSDHLCHACLEQMRVHPFQKVRRLVLGVLEKLTGLDHPDLPGFDIIGELGRGGMARVYKAVNRRTQQTVAIKVILPEMASNPDGMQLFKREVEVNRQLKHPCIVELFHPVIGQGACFFIMEFVDGTDLHALTAAQGGRLPLRTATPIFLDVLEGLAHAHRARIEVVTRDRRTVAAAGVIHRDLKPTNILVHRSGNRWHAKVADFGIAKAFGTAGFSGMTSAGQVHGTPAYWPREQLLYFRYLQPPSDVFSAAAVFYETLTGHFVRDGVPQLVEACRLQGRGPSIPDFVRLITEQPIVPIRSRDPGLPRHLAAVIDRALAEPPLAGQEHALRETLASARYPDASAFRVAFVEALAKDGFADG